MIEEMYMMKMSFNKNLDRVSMQIQNTLEQMQELGYILYYNIPKCEKYGGKEILTWNNHIGGREVSSKYFLRVKQYMKILSDNAFLAILSDYSLVRCSFVFVDNKIISENLLWWPCPIQIDSNMVEEFGLLETIEMILEDKEVEKYIRMRSPIRMDFDVENNTEEHPGAHLHMEHEECRINTDEPICFNRFINYIIKSFYPGWKVEFKEYDYINFKYDKPKHKITYNNRTKIMIE